MVIVYDVETFVMAHGKTKFPIVMTREHFREERYNSVSDIPKHLYRKRVWECNLKNNVWNLFMLE